MVAGGSQSLIPSVSYSFLSHSLSYLYPLPSLSLYHFQLMAVPPDASIGCQHLVNKDSAVPKNQLTQAMLLVHDCINASMVILHLLLLTQVRTGHGKEGCHRE